MSVDQKVFEKLVHGAQRVFENVVELYKEAVVLRDNGSTSRASFFTKFRWKSAPRLKSLGQAQLASL